MTRVPIFTASVGAGSAVWAAVSHDQVMAWSGAAVAILSTVVCAVIPVYHRWREAVRQERHADHVALLAEVRAVTRVQIELDDRVAETRKALQDLEAQLQRVACHYSRADGTARCTGTGTEGPPL